MNKTIYWKRSFDIIFSLLSLILFSPILLIIIILFKLNASGPIFFKQQRVGINGKLFYLYKLRTMPIDTPNLPSTETKEIKFTKFSKFLRRTNLDEIPQIFNILIGDMSFVGPRPCLISQEEIFSLRKSNNSLSIKPGLTGLAQINAFDGMSSHEKSFYDGKYLKKMSFLFDLKIILKTFSYLTKKPPTY